MEPGGGSDVVKPINVDPEDVGLHDTDSTKPKMATSAPGSRKKIADGEVASAATVSQNYKIATRFESQITPKFVWQLKNLQK